MPDRRIGVAAALIGTEAHVLRHWEDMGVLVPSRAPNGQRVYSDETIGRGRMIRKCQRAGFALEQIRSLRLESDPGRHAVIEAHRSRIDETIRQLQETDRFLAHLLSCRHATIVDCPDCSAFASGPVPRRVGILARSSPRRAEETA